LGYLLHLEAPAGSVEILNLDNPSSSGLMLSRFRANGYTISAEA